MAACAFPVSAVSCSSSAASLSGSLSICMASWIFAICLSRPSFLWRISSICFFCCQITNPRAPKPTSESSTMLSTIFAVFFRSLRWVTASTRLSVSAMMNMV